MRCRDRGRGQVLAGWGSNGGLRRAGLVLRHLERRNGQRRNGTRRRCLVLAGARQRGRRGQDVKSDTDFSKFPAKSRIRI